MSKTIKTYAVYGIMDWICQISSGRCIFTIPFSGGAMTTLGVTPATYTTDNAVIQMVIEKSDHFRKGKIKLNKCIVIEEKAKQKTPVVIEEKIPAEEVPTPAVEVYDAQSIDADLEPVEISDVASAKNYLVENYGLSASALRSKAKIIAAAKEKGIAFIGI